jgi:hypothetical protein
MLAGIVQVRTQNRHTNIEKHGIAVRITNKI